MNKDGSKNQIKNWTSLTTGGKKKRQTKTKSANQRTAKKKKGTLGFYWVSGELRGLNGDHNGAATLLWSRFYIPLS